jgi:hypothetical protein
MNTKFAHHLVPVLVEVAVLEDPAVDREPGRGELRDVDVAERVVEGIGHGARESSVAGDVS